MNGLRISYIYILPVQFV